MKIHACKLTLTIEITGYVIPYCIYLTNNSQFVPCSSVIFLYNLLFSVPLAMVYGILCELLKVTIPGNIDVTRHTELDVPQLPDEAIFSVQLYHRW